MYVHNLERPTPLFLLIQGRVKDVSDNPTMLDYQHMNPYRDFTIAVGIINEFGEREIVGIAAQAIHIRNSNSWRISSEYDGVNRLVSSNASMRLIIRHRLSRYWKDSKFGDVCNLPNPVIIRGESCVKDVSNLPPVSIGRDRISV